MRYVLCFFVIVFFVFGSGLAEAADPEGSATFAANPQVSVDFLLLFISAGLVFFMQAGFAMVEGGFCRAKNVTNLMAKNLMDFSIGALSFWAVGYALMYGVSWYGVFGVTKWFLGGEANDVTEFMAFIFQMVFAATAATIVSGAVAERMKFKVYLMYSFLVTAFLYPLYGHWVWGGGWLEKLPFGVGHVDFAGSGVVHAMGGFVGLAGTMVLGPRFGKYGADGKPRHIPGHNVTLASLGVFILWFGWFGFNGGSVLESEVLRLSVVLVNTNLAAAAGAATCLWVGYFYWKRYSLDMSLNGALGGLVGITAPAAYVGSGASVLIGVVAGLVVFYGIRFLDYRGVDDPVGAVSVHGFSGVWGLLSVGIFADGIFPLDGPVTGLLYGGGFGQLISQFIGAGTVFVIAFGGGMVMFTILNKLFTIRVSPEHELKGLDVAEHGVEPPDFLVVDNV